MSLWSGKRYQLPSQQQDETVKKQQEPKQSADAQSLQYIPRHQNGQVELLLVPQLLKLGLEVARAQLAYADKEASIIKQKADLEANLHILQSQKAAAAPTAEDAAYEEVHKSSKSELSQELLPCGTLLFSPVQCCICSASLKSILWGIPIQG